MSRLQQWLGLHSDAPTLTVPFRRPASAAISQPSAADQQGRRRAQHLAGSAQGFETLAVGFPIETEVFHADFSKKLLCAAPSCAVSTLSATTLTRSPIAPCKRSSAGISSRQGTHQVAQALSTTGLPLKAASVVAPFASREIERRHGFRVGLHGQRSELAPGQGAILARRRPGRFALRLRGGFLASPVHPV